MVRVVRVVVVSYERQVYSKKRVLCLEGEHTTEDKSGSSSADHLLLDTGGILAARALRVLMACSTLRAAYIRQERGSGKCDSTLLGFS